MYPIYN